MRIILLGLHGLRRSLRTFSIAFFLVVAAPYAMAAVPNAINYQGFLADATGKPINATTNITFKLYTVVSGGAALWTETDSLNVVEGRFTTSLGDGTAFPATLFNNASLYLGIAVASDGEMSPRTALTTTPFTFKAQDADSLDGLDSTAFLKKSGGSMLGNLKMQSGLIEANGGVNFKNEGNITNLVDLAFGQGLSGGIQFEDGSFQDTNAVNSILAADGAGSGLDADLLDGKSLNSVIEAAKDSWRVVVASSGGDYTSINAAISAINPTASNPFVVEVRPGIYNENVRLKSYVHLKGASKETTKIFPLLPGGSGNDAEDFAAIAMTNLTAVKVSGFTLAGGAFEGDNSSEATYGIYDIGSSPVITDNHFQYFSQSGPAIISGVGVYSENSRPTITDNELNQNSSAGVYILDSRAVITRNTFNENGGGSLSCGVANISSKTIINSNIFKGNGVGVCAQREGSNLPTTTITSNQFTDNYNAIHIESGMAQIAGNNIDTENVNDHFGVFIDTQAKATISGNTIKGYFIGVINSGESDISGNQISDGPPQVSTGIENHGASNIIGNMLNNLSRGIIDTTGNTQIVGNQLRHINQRNIGAQGGAQVFANSMDNNASISSVDNKIITKEGFLFESTGGGFAVSAGGSSITLSSAGNITIVSAGDITFDAADDIILKAGDDVEITGGGTGLIDLVSTTTIKGSTINVNANSRLNLSAATEIDLTTNKLIDMNAGLEVDVLSKRLDFNSTGVININAVGSFDVDAAGVDIDSSSSVDVKGSIINLN